MITCKAKNCLHYEDGFGCFGCSHLDPDITIEEDSYSGYCDDYEFEPVKETQMQENRFDGTSGKIEDLDIEKMISRLGDKKVKSFTVFKDRQAAEDAQKKKVDHKNPKSKDPRQRRHQGR